VAAEADFVLIQQYTSAVAQTSIDICVYRVVVRLPSIHLNARRQKLS
jgi:hypothetical protein